LLIAAYLLFGTGSGLVNTPITSTAMSGMPRFQAGVAGAIASTGRQVGNSLGVAVLGSVITQRAALAGSPRPARPAGGSWLAAVR
jgi:hypothetical protein